MKSARAFTASSLLQLLALSHVCFSQNLQPPGAFAPLVEACGPTAGIVCVNKYVSTRWC